MIGEIADIATAVAALIPAASLFAQSRDRKFGLAQVYIQRYWEIDDKFIEEGHPGCGANARRHLRLREDEFEVTRQGRIDFGVWRTWHSGIRSRVAELDLEQEVSKYELLSKCIGSPDPNHSARKCKALGKAGLRRRVWWWLEGALGG